MLGLRHEVDGDEARIGRLVGHDAHLGRTGDHVDAHIAADELLRSGHERVARAGDLVDRRDLLGAVRERGDGLRAANRVDLGDARELACLEDGRIERAVLGGRVDHDDALDARHARRQRIHEQGRRVERTTAGHVDAHRVERRDLRSHDGAVLARGEPALLELTLVELADLRGCMLERLGERRIALRDGLVDGLLRHAEVLDLDTVELGRELAQALVAALADIFDDLGRDLHGLRVECALALQVGVVEHLALG